MPSRDSDRTQYAWDDEAEEEVHIGYREDWADRRGTRWTTQLRDDAEIAEHSSWGRRYSCCRDPTCAIHVETVQGGSRYLLHHHCKVHCHYNVGLFHATFLDLSSHAMEKLDHPHKHTFLLGERIDDIDQLEHDSSYIGDFDMVIFADMKMYISPHCMA